MLNPACRRQRADGSAGGGIVESDLPFGLQGGQNAPIRRENETIAIETIQHAAGGAIPDSDESIRPSAGDDPLAIRRETGDHRVAIVRGLLQLTLTRGDLPEPELAVIIDSG